MIARGDASADRRHPHDPDRQTGCREEVPQARGRLAGSLRGGRRGGSKRCAAAVVAAALALACQPRDETPGLWLRGETVLERVDDWRFTNAVEEIFVQTRPWYGIAHSTTIWCVELDGELYIGSYGDQKKAWEKNVERDPEAELAIAGKLYPVTVTPVTEPGRIEALDAAYAQKYDMAEVFGEGVPEWWYYRVTSRP